jgi:hypothetical protein
VLDTTPGHIGDVKEAVETVEVNEGTIIGDVFDLATTGVARLDILKQLTALLHTLLFNELATRETTMFLRSRLILMTLKVVGLANVLIEILRRLHIDLRRRHEGIDTDAHDQAALNFGANTTLNDRAFFTVLDDLLPVLLLLGLVERDNRVTFLVFELFEKDFNFSADLQFTHIDELGCVNDAFGFATNIDNDFGGADLDNGSFENGTLFEVIYVAARKQLFHEITHILLYVTARRGGSLVDGYYFWIHPAQCRTDGPNRRRGTRESRGFKGLRKAKIGGSGRNRALICRANRVIILESGLQHHPTPTVMNPSGKPSSKTEVLVDLHQLVYVSIATRDFDENDLRDILQVSRKNNAEQGITGLLLISKRNIVQVLEGAKEPLKQLLEKIRRDPRHRQVTILSFDPAPKRSFKDWSMGYKRIEVSEFEAEFPGFTDIVERKKVNLDILSGLSIKVSFVLNRFSQMNRLDDLGQAC